MASFADILARNKTYAEKHTPTAFLSERTAPPPGVFIFSCVDFRVPVEEILDLKEDEAFICRNVGGRLKSSFSSLVYLDNLTQGQVIKEVVVIHHLDCGATRTTDEAVKATLKEKVPQAAAEIDRYEFGTYDGSSMEMHQASIKEDLDFLRASPLVSQEIKDRARGFVYDMKSGKLIPVQA